MGGLLWLAISLWLAALVSSPLRAHEVLPTIADLETSGPGITLSVRLNAEAFLAGIDLDALTDTNDTDQSGAYDALRAVPGAALADRLSAALPGFLQGLAVSSGGAGVPLIQTTISVEDVADLELPRTTTLVLTGDLPPGARTVSLAWGAGYGMLILRQTGVENPYTALLEGGQTSAPIPLSGGVTRSGWETFVDYIPVGFDHILPKGLDHILFVLGLFFLSTRLGPLVWQVSAFTLAHTITLALGALGWVNVPASIVEPLIAASIIYVAVENIWARGLTPWRPVVVFLFGLLHGLGFASVLGEFGLPAGQFIPALLGFNIGVEIGQLTVIAIAFVLVGAWFGSRPWYHARIAIPASCAIAGIGAYWVIERTLL